MEEFTPNSDKAKAEERRLNKVVTGEVVQKKPMWKEAIDEFVIEDKNSITRYVIFEEVIPGLKNIAANVVDRILFPNGGGRRQGYRDNRQYVSYDRRYDQLRGSNQRQQISASEPRSPLNSYNDFIFASKIDAENVLEGLLDNLDNYQSTSIMDLYSLAGEPCDYTYNKYGWTNLGQASIERVHDGYAIRLPKPRVL